jgi:5-methylcytosine-specific restriction endonuclease McrA
MTSTSRYAGRSTHRYKTLRSEFRSRCKARNVACWLCGKTIDYSLPHTHPDSFNVDHAIPVSQRRDLAEDTRNLRAAHRVCNERRGNEEPVLNIGSPSESW